MSRSESPKRAVWLRGVEIMEMDRQHLAQVASVDDQGIRSPNVVAGGAPGGLRKIRIPVGGE